MTRLALKQTRLGPTASQERTVSAFLPYTRHVDDTTIATKDGFLFQVIALDGIAFETADQSTLNHLKTVRNTLWGEAEFLFGGISPRPDPVRSTRASRPHGSIIGVVGWGLGLVPRHSEAETS